MVEQVTIFSNEMVAGIVDEREMWMVEWTMVSGEMNNEQKGGRR